MLRITCIPTLFLVSKQLIHEEFIKQLLFAVYKYICVVISVYHD